MATKPQVQANDQAMDAMAEEGRVTDDVMAHLTEGEIVIPLAIAHNRRAVQQLAMMFELAGLDFEEFVVGSPKQKINPETGHPEFFSLSVGPVSVSVGGGGASVSVGGNKASVGSGGVKVTGGGGVLGKVVNTIAQPINTVGDVIKDVSNTAVNVTKDVTSTATTVAKDVINLDPKAAISDTVGGVKAVGSDVVAGTKQAVKDTYTGATKTLAYAMDALGILPNVPKVNAPTNGQTSGATVTQGDQVQRNQSVTDVQAAAGGGASSLTPRTVAGPDSDYKLNKSAVLGL